VIAYIRGQPRHHEKRSFEQKLVAILQESEIDHDARFIFG
jgi:hypothetical protein